MGLKVGVPNSEKQKYVNNGPIAEPNTKHP